MKQHPFTRRAHHQLAPAFTLVELMVVIAIITVLMTVGSMGLKNLSKASGVSSGVPIAEAVFSEARALAIAEGSRARVLIHGTNDIGDNLHRERYLRYMVVQYMTDDNGTPDDDADDVWEIASRGVKLPDGVYFVPSLSDLGTAPDVPTLDATLPGDSDTTCYYYEYNSQGIITNPSPSGNDVPRFVIRAGSLPPGQAEPIASGSAGKKNAGGFVIWRNGHTSIFRHPDQIDPDL